GPGRRKWSPLVRTLQRIGGAHPACARHPINGGAGQGTVFELSPTSDGDWTETVAVSLSVCKGWGSPAGRCSLGQCWQLVRSYSAGIDLNGAVIKQDKDETAVLYGKVVPFQTILSGGSNVLVTIPLVQQSPKLPVTLSRKNHCNTMLDHIWLLNPRAHSQL